MSNSLKVNKCPICNNRSKNIHKQFSYEKTINKKVLLKLNQCNALNCHHIFLAEYNKGDLAKHYKYPRYETKITNADIDYTLSRVNFIKNNSNFKKIKSVLELGPGEGFFLRYLNIKNKYFYDLNPNVIKKLKQKFNYFNLKKKNKNFDLICVCHMLEHVYNPYIFLKGIKSSLSKDGKIFIEIPDFSYFSEPDNVEGIIYEHLHYFSIKSIQNLFDKLGFEIIAIKRNLNKDNKTCINYALQILATFKKSKKNTIRNILKAKYDDENRIIKKYLKYKKNILVWGIGTNFLKFAIKIKLPAQKNIFFTDVREYGKKIFGFNIKKPNEFYKKNFDLVVVATSDITNVKESLSKLKIKFNHLLKIKS